MSDAACILSRGTMSYHYHQKIARANKCEIGTDFSLQLLVLISPAILSNVHPLPPFKLWKQTSALRDSTKKLEKPSPPTCVHLFHSHDSTEFSCAVHLHEAGSNVYTVLEG